MGCVGRDIEKPRSMSASTKPTTKKLYLWDGMCIKRY